MYMCWRSCEFVLFLDAVKESWSLQFEDNAARTRAPRGTPRRTSWRTPRGTTSRRVRRTSPHWPPPHAPCRPPPSTSCPSRIWHGPPSLPTVDRHISLHLQGILHWWAAAFYCNILFDFDSKRQQKISRQLIFSRTHDWRLSITSTQKRHLGDIRDDDSAYVCF